MQKAAPNSYVAVLGASPNEERYSFKAVHILKENGHKPIPVHPAGHEVDGVAGVKSLDDIEVSVDTLTVYVNSSISDAMYDEIIRLSPRRVIFNPGAENYELAKRLEKAGIEIVRACTLVMLRTGMF